jgi:pSer/pThr/pTyr-binding forkhead associated (FHA) protein
MRDGRTRRVEVDDEIPGFEKFLGHWRAAVVVMAGGDVGAEREIEAPSIVIGRGPTSDWRFSDETMSKEHAALEFSGGGIRLRDLGSMNGLRVNGGDTKVADLKNGDRFQIGEHEFQFVLEQRRRQPRTYVLPDA